MELKRTELMQLFLSVYTIEKDNCKDVSAFDDQFDKVFEEYSNVYEVTEFDKEQEKEDTTKLMEKLLLALYIK